MVHIILFFYNLFVRIFEKSILKKIKIKIATNMFVFLTIIHHVDIALKVKLFENFYLFLLMRNNFRIPKLQIYLRVELL